MISMNTVELENIIEQIEGLFPRRQYAELKKVLMDINPADIAILFEHFKIDQCLVMFRLLPKEEAADTFVELDYDVQQQLVSAFSDKELKEVLDELFLDDAVDMIEEMPASVVKKIMKNTDAQTRKSINTLLNYPEDSAGSIMTPEFVDLKSNMTVIDAFIRIKLTAVDKETVYTCYVTDASRHLIGVTTVKELLTHDADDIIGDFMQTNVIYVTTLEDQEKATHELSKYNFLALPVVDSEKRLVGIITVDDAMDVLEEETTEDIQKMNAMLPTEKTYFKTSVFETWKARIPWLMLLMLSATFTGIIISSFEAPLGKLVALTAFIPMLMDTGGNSGSQASVTVIRALSLGEVRVRDILKVMFKEFKVALLCGVTLSVTCFAKVMLVDGLLFKTEGVNAKVALVVALTIFATVICAKLIGCSLPLIAKQVKLDPAVMASPFITTIVDSISLLIYFGIATAIIPGLR